MDYAIVLDIISDTFSSMRRSGFLDPDLKTDEDTVLLGTGSPLDSISFVTFMVELEEKLTAEKTKDQSVCALILEDIHEYNPDDTKLTVRTLSNFVVEHMKND